MRSHLVALIAACTFGLCAGTAQADIIREFSLTGNLTGGGITYTLGGGFEMDVTTGVIASLPIIELDETLPDFFPIALFRNLLSPSVLFVESGPVPFNDGTNKYLLLEVFAGGVDYNGGSTGSLIFICNAENSCSSADPLFASGSNISITTDSSFDNSPAPVPLPSSLVLFLSVISLMGLGSAWSNKRMARG